MFRFSILASLFFAACAVSEPAVAPELRVASYNVKHGLAMEPIAIRDNLERQAEILRDLRADVVGLQEIDVGCRRSDSIDEAAFFGKATGLKPSFGRFMEYDGGEYGLAMLCRHDAEVERLELPPGRREPRCALIQTFRLPSGVPITCVNVHFDWLRRSPERLAQARAVLERLSTVKHAVVVLGDFNASRKSPTLDAFRTAGFRCLPKRDGVPTFHASDPKVEIDHVCVRDGDDWRVIDEPVVVLREDVASDHRPLVVTLRFERRGERD